MEEDFCIFLRGTDSQPSIMTFPIAEQKHLDGGQWKCSLSEISYKKTNLEFWISEPLYFLLLVNEEKDLRRFEAYSASMELPETKIKYISEFDDDYFVGFKASYVFAVTLASQKKALATPGGLFDIMNFLVNVPAAPFRQKQTESRESP